jgi:hypothetical protein
MVYRNAQLGKGCQQLAILVDLVEGYGFWIWFFV